MTRYALLFVLVTACDGRALEAHELPITPEPCCVGVDNGLRCKDGLCPELAAGKECTTLGGLPDGSHYCQVPTTNDCEVIYLERTTQTSNHDPFQTVYCF